jgi:protein-S-isoprenylcysteine O-methyltransferase Ste14
MLGRFELLGGIGGAFRAVIISRLAMQHRGNYLPPGTVILDNPLPNAQNSPVGTQYSRVGLTIAFELGVWLAIFVIIACIFDFWNFLPITLFFELPIWLNWVGMVSSWILNVWGLVAMYYNVNFTLAFWKGKHLLATGGPYKWVRHPQCTATCIFSISFFLATELWPALLGIFFWGAVRAQAIAEEKLLQKNFREAYEKYYKTTGRFFPKWMREPSIGTEP